MGREAVPTKDPREDYITGYKKIELKMIEKDYKTEPFNKRLERTRWA